MECHQCGGPSVGACTTCGRFFCEDHRKDSWGQALCAACEAKAQKLRTISMVVLAVLTLVMLAFMTGR